MGAHDTYVSLVGKGLKNQKSLYKVLTPSIKPPHINSYGLIWKTMTPYGVIGQ